LGRLPTAEEETEYIGEKILRALSATPYRNSSRRGDERKERETRGQNTFRSGLELGGGSGDSGGVTCKIQGKGELQKGRMKERGGDGLEEALSNGSPYPRG